MIQGSGNDSEWICDTENSLCASFSSLVPDFNYVQEREASQDDGAPLFYLCGMSSQCDPSSLVK